MRLLALCTGVAAFGLAGPAAAQTCETATLSGLPGVAEAVSQWETVKEAGLTDGARARFASLACLAVARVSRQSGAPAGEVDAGSGDAVVAYLDSTLEDGGSVPSLEARLATDFILNARPSLPEPPTFGRIRIRYSQQVDELLVANRIMAPRALLISEAGRVAIAGRRARAVVCQATVSVSPALDAVVNC